MDEQQSQNQKTVKWNPHDFPKVEKPTVGIEFFNVNSGERRVCDSEALITAFYNSSNLHVNAMVGQDLGWRLAPVTVKRMRDIREDEAVIARIVTRFRLNEESEITDPHLLTWMFLEDLRQAAKREEQEQNQYQQQYEEELRQINEGTDVLSTETLDTPPQTEQLKKATAAAKPRLNAAQRKTAAKQAADAKRREENIAAGRDINDGIELSPEEKAALEGEANPVAKENKSDDNSTQS